MAREHLKGKQLSKKQKKRLKRKEQQLANSKGLAVSTCSGCEQPWDEYLGKHKCIACGVPVLLCVRCLSRKKQTRCPLCVEEDRAPEAKSSKQMAVCARAHLSLSHACKHAVWNLTRSVKSCSSKSPRPISMDQ